MPLPTDFFAEDRNYRIRACITIALDPIVGLYTGSQVQQCDRCGEPIWVNIHQELPAAPDVEIHGDVNVCFPCVKWIMEQAGEQAGWIPGHGPDD